MPEEIVNSVNEISIPEMAAKIKSLTKYLRSKWLIICTTGVFAAIAGFCYAWMQDKQYEAVLTFSMEDDKSQGGGIAGLAAQFGLDIGSSGGVFSGENIIALLESNKIGEATLLTTVDYNSKQTSLLNIFLEKYNLNKGFRNSNIKELRELRFPETQDASTFSRLQDSVLMLVLKKIHTGIVKIAKPDSKINLYSITCRSPDEIFSAQYCSQLIKQAATFYITTKTKRSSLIVNILQKKADSLHTALNAALTGRAELSDANINASLQLATVGILSKQTDISVIGTAYGELLKNLELAKFNLLKETPVIQVLDEPMQPLKIIKLSRLLAGIIAGFLCGLICVVYLTFKYLLKRPQ